MEHLDPTQLGFEKVGEQPVDKLGCRALERQDFASRQHCFQNLCVARRRVMGGLGGVEEALHSQFASTELFEAASHLLDIYRTAGEGQWDQEEEGRERSKVTVGCKRFDVVAVSLGDQAIWKRQSNLQGNAPRPPGLKRPQRSCRAVQLQRRLHCAGYVGDVDLPCFMVPCVLVLAMVFSGL